MKKSLLQFVAETDMRQLLNCSSFCLSKDYFPLAHGYLTKSIAFTGDTPKDINSTGPVIRDVRPQPLQEK